METEKSMAMPKPEKVFVCVHPEGDSLFGSLALPEDFSQPTFLQAMSIDSDFVNYGRVGETLVFADLELTINSNPKSEMTDEELYEAGVASDEDFKRMFHPYGTEGPDEDADI